MTLACGSSDYGIGLTPGGIVSLRRLGVAVPDQVIYSAAAVHYGRSDFQRVGDGFSSLQWIYDIISLSSLYKLMSFLEGSDSKALYVQSDQRDGTFPNPASAFKIYSATMWKPIVNGEEGVPVVRSALTYQTVKFTFMNAVEQAGYL